MNSKQLTRRNILDILVARKRSPTSVEVARVQRYLRGAQRCMDYDALSADLRDFVDTIHWFLTTDPDLSTLYND